MGSPTPLPTLYLILSAPGLGVSQMVHPGMAAQYIRSMKEPVSPNNAPSICGQWTRPDEDDEENQIL